MKKITALTLTIILCFALCACGKTNEVSVTETSIITETAPTVAITEATAPIIATTAATTTAVTTQSTAPTVFEIGTAAATDSCEINVSSCNFQKSWQFADVVVQYEDKSFVVLEFTVRNVGKTSFNLMFVNPSVDYNNGYIFKPDFFDYNGRSYSSAFLYSTSGTILEPLSAAKQKKAAIIVPNEVVENTSAPLLIKFSVPSTAGTQVLAFRVR